MSLEKGIKSCMPLPPPLKKKHHCEPIGSRLFCETNENNEIILGYMDTTHIVRLKVMVCPFCCETAEKKHES